MTPYSFSGHWPQDVPLGKEPVGQLDTHVFVVGSSSRGAVHVRQLVALVTQVAQLLLHAAHTLLAPTYVPAGQLLAHVFPFRSGSVDVALQLVHADEPAAKHVRHVGEQAMQRIHFLMDFEGAADAGDIEQAGPPPGENAE